MTGLEEQKYVCTCTHLATMFTHGSWALISDFSTDGCHQHSYQKYIPDHNHGRTGCQNTSDHMIPNERWKKEHVWGVTGKAIRKWGHGQDTGQDQTSANVSAAVQPKNRFLLHDSIHGSDI